MAIRAKVLTVGIVLMLTGGVAAQEPVVVEWLRAHAVPLTTVEPRHGFEDLQPLKKVIGTAHIVALGEATHGSREIFSSSTA